MTNTNGTNNTFVRERQESRQRVPLNQQSGALVAPDVGPDYEPALVNMIPGNVERYQRAGYVFVHGESGEKRSSDASQRSSLNELVVNWQKDAPCTHAVWMKIKKEYYEADQKAKHAEHLAQLDGLDPTKDRLGIFTGGLEIEKGNKKI